MCKANDLPLSLKSDTFNALCSDFDQIIRSTLSGMEETEQDVAEANVKVKITLTPDSAPDFSVAGGQQTRAITKPKFDHTVSAVIQKKEKKTGTLSGNYELVWDRESCCYVMRPIDNGQVSMFDEPEEVGGRETGGDPPENALPAPQHPALPGEVIDADYEVIEDPKAEGDKKDGGEPEDGSDGGHTDPKVLFGYMKQYVGAEMKVLEAMGHYTVRTMSNQVILSSACKPTDRFYCSPEKLAPHVGHSVVCIGYGQDEIVSISIECEDCNEVLFEIEAPKEDDPPAEGESHDEGEGDGYQYNDPEEGE